MKKCVVCGEKKDLCEFPKKDSLSYRGKCKVCYNERKREIKKMTEEERNKIRNNKQSINIVKEVKKNKKIRACVICGDMNEENFYSSNKNKCKSCISSEYKNREDKKDYINNQRKWRENNLIHYRVESAKHRAVRKGIIFEITDDDIIEKLKNQNNKCFISKQTISMNENDWYSLSLDRMDNSIGYTKDNTIVVTKFVNSSKNDLSLDIFLKMLKEVCDNNL